MNRFQKLLLEVYAGGEGKYLTEKQIPRCGDTLLIFLYRELSDVESQADANQRMEMALRDLNNVAERIDRMDNGEDQT